MVKDAARLDGALFYNAPALRLSIVMPTLEEEVVIGGFLDYLYALPGIGEAVVADGGRPP